MSAPSLNTIDFQLKDQNAQLRNFKEFQGQWVILYFYPKDDTPGCTTEACDFNDNLTAFSSSNATVIGVSPDSPESHKKFMEKYQLQITLLSDPEKKLHHVFGTWGIKKNYGKEYEGVIRSTFIIAPNGTVQESMRNVRAKGHAARVLKKFQELQL
ncbi:MAG: peroxiredoxin [Waddliaceae bacterium]|nr:peroxiredoxin [Waddliaceae bacterium]